MKDFLGKKRIKVKVLGRNKKKKKHERNVRNNTKEKHKKWEKTSEEWEKSESGDPGWRRTGPGGRRGSKQLFCFIYSGFLCPSFGVYFAAGFVCLCFLLLVVLRYSCWFYFCWCYWFHCCCYCYYYCVYCFY